MMNRHRTAPGQPVMGLLGLVAEQAAAGVQQQQQVVQQLQHQ
jgi:hypothetical protein